MQKKAYILTCALAVGALMLSGCASSPTPTSSPSNVPSSATPSSSNGDASGYTVSSDPSSKPVVEIAAGAGNVDNLVVKDIIEGTGAAVQSTDNVTVHYVGIGALSQQQFDSSWDAGTTASFPLNGVILGWQQGLVGMKVGGRRLLVIPGALAYGANPPAGSGIQADETLIFVVDLVSIP
jgi:peptidylprolyl isomerase